jgi:methylated-DNA-[protein]-cysteine S-methyltransferase
LCAIPYAEVRTYKEVASKVGNPKASRAVGMANAKNPIPIIIPCHRVIGSNGTLTGFAHGLAAKQMLLHLETHTNEVNGF